MRTSLLNCETAVAGVARTAPSHAPRILRFVRPAFLGLLAALATAVAQARLARADDVVCLRRAIEGCEKAAEQAHAAIGKDPTFAADRARAYLTLVDDSLYIHSNYLAPGAEYPVKVLLKSRGEDPVESLDGLARMILDPLEEVHTRKWSEKVDEVAGRVLFLVDERVLAHPKFGPMVEKLQGAYVVNREMFQVEPGVFVRASSPQRASSFLETLDGLPYERERLRVISLVADTATSEAGTARFGSRFTSLASSPSISAIQEQFAYNKRGIVALIGHRELDKFVVRGADGKILASLSVHDIVTSAREKDVTLVLLGCDTAAVPSAPIGSLGRVGSVQVIQRLANGDTQDSVRGFLGALAGDDGQIMIREGAFEGYAGAVGGHLESRLPLSKVALRTGTGAGLVVVALVPGSPPKPTGDDDENELAFPQEGGNPIANALRAFLDRDTPADVRARDRMQRTRKYVLEALPVFKKAAALGMVLAPERWARMCRLAALAGEASEGLFAGDKAVDLDPDSAAAWDSRGLARALSGDTRGALRDFAMYFVLANGQSPAQRARRLAWMMELGAGKNPIDEKEIGSVFEEEDN